MAPRPHKIVALFLCLTLPCAAPKWASGQGASNWQPYRDLAPIESQVVAPVQYAVDVPMEVQVPDPVTGVELQQMCAPYCSDPFDASQTAGPTYVDSRFADPVLVPVHESAVWDWHLLPDDVIWHSYWAGAKEPRISGAAFNESSSSTSLLDVSLGGRTSVLRFGTTVDGRPEGWELQLEGAGLLRLNLDQNWDFDAADFRFGLPIVYGEGRSQWKFSYYHLSSHVGDEFLVRNPGFMRINYSRDTLVLGYSFYPRPSCRWYAEAGWAFYADEGSDPWEFQFGIDIAQPGPTGARGTPFAAVNGHLRQEVNFGGNLVVQAGWLWRGKHSPVLRAGLHYYNGKSSQFEFYDQFEQQIGLGLWYDY